MPSLPVVVLLAASVLLPGCDRLAALASGRALQAFEARCEALPPVRVDVVRVPNEVAENRTLAYDDLARLAEPTAANHRTVGLTRAKFGYRSTLQLDGLEDPRNGRACGRPRVHVDVELTSMTVYVAREYHGDACREPMILEHERKHVEVFERYTDDVAAALAQELERGLGRAVRYDTSMAAMQATLKAELAVNLESFMGRARNELAARHAEVDTPHEYDQLARMCGSTP